MHTRQQPKLVLLAACGLLAAMVAGCQRGSHRVEVVGTVTYQGKPIPQGAITFIPSEGADAPRTMATIVDGKYNLDALRGLMVGTTYQVSIAAVRPRAASEGVPMLSPDAEEQYIPAKYNAKTELKITIEPGQRSVTRDFTLTD